MILQWYDSYETFVISWSIASATLFLASIRLLLEGKRDDLRSRKNVYYGFGLFSLLFGFTRFFFVISDFTGDLHDTMIVIGYLTGILGLNIVIYILETYLIKSRKILSIITFICFIILVIAVLGLATRDTALIMIYILAPAALIASALVYVYLILNSTGPSRHKAIAALIGMILMFLGHFMESNLFSETFTEVPIIIAPCILIVGVIVFTKAQLLSQEKS